MDLFSNLALGFATASSFENLFFCLIGVLPGIGATATIAMLLPITFQLEPVSSLIMLAGIYYGAQYGGSTTAILINMPGESSSAVTAIDETRPTIISEKYSAAPTCKAISVSGGAKIATRKVETVPAKKEPSAAMASAAPARPLRAIW